jgi:hypothetical protein
MIKSLTVWWDGAEVGRLRIDEHGELSFSYDAAWRADPQSRAISISLPKWRSRWPGERHVRSPLDCCRKKDSGRPSLARSASLPPVIFAF